MEDTSFASSLAKVSPFKPIFVEFHQEGIKNDSPVEVTSMTPNKRNRETIANGPKQLTTSGSTSSIHKQELGNSHEIRKKSIVALVSEFHGQKLIQTHRRKYLQSLWMDLHEQILNTPIEQISSLKEYAEEVIGEITKADLTYGLLLKELLIELFVKVETYDSSISSSWDRMSKQTHVELLSKVTTQLKEVKGAKEKLTSNIQCLEEKVQSIEDKKILLQKELANLEVQSVEICSTIDQMQESLKKIQAKVAQVHDDISSIENANILTEDAAKELEDMKSFLESCKAAVIDHKFDI